MSLYSLKNLPEFSFLFTYTASHTKTDIYILLTHNLFFFKFNVDFFFVIKNPPH